MVEAIETEDGVVLASDVDVADGLLSRMRGMMFRRPPAEGYALVFEFERERRLGVHMLFVVFPLDVVFLDSDDVVVSVRRLPAWRGFASERACRAVELPAGGADDVEPGDRLVFVE
ncbi:MAG: DUF192 domain-containing protein [Halobacteriota archaeon]